MADNTVVNAGSGGDTIATDEIAGVKHQRVKIQYGVDGSATDVSDTNPLPIDDAGGSITVDAASLPLPAGAATAANQLADGHNVTVDNASGASAVNVQDGGNSLTVDGTVTANAGTGDFLSVTGHTRNEAFKESNAVGGELDDTATVAATEGNVSPARITAQRAFHTNLRNDAGTEIATASNPVRTDPTGSTTQPISAASLPLPTGAATSANQLPDGHNVTVDNAGGASAVNIQDGGNTITVDGTVTSDAGTGFPAVATDASAHGASQTGTRAMGTDGTNDQQISVNATGHVNIADGGNTITVDGTVTADAGTGDFLSVTGHTRNEAFKESNAIGGELDDTSPVLATEGNVSPARITAARALHMNLRSNSGTELGTASNPVRVDGADAHDSAAPDANPVVGGGRSETPEDTAVTNQVSAEGDVARFAVDRDGALFTHPHPPRIWHVAAEQTAQQTDTTVKAAPGASLSLYITDIYVVANAAVDITFEEGTTTFKFKYYAGGQGDGVSKEFKVPLKLTANTAFTVTTSAAVNVSYVVCGYTGP
jgi:hypothetical protein